MLDWLAEVFKVRYKDSYSVLSKNVGIWFYSKPANLYFLEWEGLESKFYLVTRMTFMHIKKLEPMNWIDAI